MMSDDKTVEQKSAEENSVDELVVDGEEIEETAVTTTATEETEETEEFDDDGLPRKPRKQKNKQRTSPALRQIVSWFSACGRCSFFLAGYQLISDAESLETAVANRGKKWLTIPWSRELAKLIHKTYGNRIDISCYHMAGQCPECSRRFTYQQSEKEDQPAILRIEIRP